MATETEMSREVLPEQVEFRPVVGSSGHRPITRGDFAEFVGEEVLARLLRDNPVVVEAVLIAREERQRAIELAQEEERLRAKAERAGADEQDFVREAEVAERAQLDAAWARETAVALAKARAQEKWAEFVVETYTPPELHVFVLSSFVHYAPQREDCDSELVLRDPEVQLLATWTEV